MTDEKKGILNSIQDWLETNPLATLVTILIAVAGLSAAVVMYFEEKVLNAERGRHSQEIARLNTEHKANIADLNSRLRSIACGVEAQPVYLDLNSLLVEDEDLRVLDTNFKRIGEGIFYVDTPKDPPWEYLETNKLNILRLLYGEKSKIFFGSERSKALHRKMRVYLWSGPSKLTIRVTPFGAYRGIPGDALPNEINLFPRVMVQDMDMTTVRTLKKYSADNLDFVTVALAEYLQHGLALANMYENVSHKILAPQQNVC